MAELPSRAFIIIFPLASIFAVPVLKVDSPPKKVLPIRSICLFEVDNFELFAKRICSLVIEIGLSLDTVAFSYRMNELKPAVSPIVKVASVVSKITESVVVVEDVEGLPIVSFRLGALLSLLIVDLKVIFFVSPVPVDKRV